MSELVLRLGTRRSPLALAQSRQVAAALERRHPGLEVELVPIIARGDRLEGDLSQLGGKGLFTTELEDGLLSGALDLAVHSLKDLPVELPAGLTLAAYPTRADPRDALVSEVAETLEELPRAAVLLTGSQRRRAQLLGRRGDLRVEPIRGNVGTRLAEWRASGHAGVILAAAGLERLGLAGEGLAGEGIAGEGLKSVPVHPIDPRILVPAPGQGILAVEVREGSRAEPICRTLDDPETARAADAERRIVRAFGGDCTLPLAAWASADVAGLRLVALLASPDGRRICRGEATGVSAAAAATACLEEMYHAGARELLAELRP